MLTDVIKEKWEKEVKKAIGQPLDLFDDQLGEWERLIERRVGFDMPEGLDEKPPKGSWDRWHLGLLAGHGGPPKEEKPVGVKLGDFGSRFQHPGVVGEGAEGGAGVVVEEAGGRKSSPDAKKKSGLTAEALRDMAAGMGDASGKGKSGGGVGGKDSGKKMKKKEDSDDDSDDSESRRKKKVGYEAVGM